jgi:N-acyl-phosphatidylethanolamine-hydrolysing phospholipase D
MRRLRRGPALVGMMLIMAFAFVLPGCTLGGIFARNARWFFHRPGPAPRSDLPRADDARLSVLWVGHATVLLQIDDRYLLTDPVFTERVGTFSRRLVEAGLPARALPPHLSVVVSHRHFDHLSPDSFPLIADRVDDVLTPEGAGADVPRGAYAVHELCWWSSFTRDGLRITAVPAAHEGNRFLHDGASHPRAFGGYVIEYHGLGVYFAGDTAYDASLFEALGRRFPRLDLALLPIGPIEPATMMRAHHIAPSEALDAFAALGASALVPIHFATFLHSYDEVGDVERAFDLALANRPALGPRAHRIEIGERLVVWPRGGAGLAHAR